MHKKIGLFENDPTLASQIEEVLTSEKFTLTRYRKLGNLKSDVQARKLDLVLADLLLPNCPLSSEISVEEFTSNSPKDVPVIMLSQSTDLSTRLVALRSGIKAYLTKPIDNDELLEKIESTLCRNPQEHSKILICDDDPMLTEFYKIALEEEGFTVKVVNNPLKVLDEIERFKPDIITLDYLMPGCNGLEVAEILRGDPRHTQTPIVFMSAAEEAIERKGVMNLFSDIFLHKPVAIKQLSDTLSEICANTKKSQRKSSEKISEHQKLLSSKFTYLLDEVATLVDHAISEGDDEGEKVLILATLDQKREFLKRYNITMCKRIDRNLEDFLSKYPLINGQGCRLGKGEFLMLMDKPRNEKVQSSLEKLFESVKKIRSEDLHGTLGISFSVGAVLLGRRKAKDFQECYEHVRNSNSLAKSAGGNKVLWADLERKNTYPNKIIIRALKKSSFQLAFQPIIKVDSDEHIFETLVRLKDEDGNIHPPNSFIDSVDNTVDEGTYRLDRWVIENAFNALENLSGREAAEFSLVIKLTPQLKQVERLMPFIFNITSNTRLRGNNRIYFSLPEKTILTDINRANKIVASLHTANCGFMFEHCAASEHSLHAIKSLERLDFVKLHPSIHKESPCSPSAKKRIKNIQNELKEKGELIATAVEDARIFAHYWELNIRFFQGFFIHRPNERMHYRPCETETLVLEK